MIRRRHHRGLATLELVLALPILLMVMALMIDVGVIACWKVRALNMARHTVWETRWPRTGGPAAAYYTWHHKWPDTPGSKGAGAGSNVTELDDPRVDQPVARGPTLPLGTQVKRDLLDPSRGLREGTADITPGLPMLPKLGSYPIRAQNWLLDDKWQYQRMGMSSNTQQRIPIIYILAKAPPALSSAYTQAVTAILSAPFRQDLAPLDKDDEFRGYGQLFGWGTTPPDFHPRLQQFCTLDQDAAKTRVDNLVDRIQGKDDGRRRVASVAETMTQGFIGLYQRVIRALGSTPGGQSQIAQIQQKIDVLNKFLQTLQ